MTSDFARGRRHLEEALQCFCGNDEMSKSAREAIELLIEAAASMEFRRTAGPKSDATVIDFQQATRQTKPRADRSAKAPRPSGKMRPTR